MIRDWKTGRDGTPLDFHFALIFVLFCVLPFLFAPFSYGADKIASQDFESPGWESEFTGQGTWDEHLARTTHDPFSGSHSLRWNQNQSRIDPITGRPGRGNPILDWRGGVNIPNLTPHEMFFRLRFRHDDYANDIDWASATRKLFYLVDVNYNVGAMFVSRQLGQDIPYISYTNGNYSDVWARNNWGGKNMHVEHPNVSAGSNGEWRTCEFYINYDEHFVMIWIDGNLMIPKTWPPNDVYWDLYPERAAAGQIVYDPGLNLKFKGFQIAYFDHTRDCLNCRDESEYYCGFQIDDLEVWNGIPGAPPGPDSPGPCGQPEHVPPSSP